MKNIKVFFEKDYNQNISKGIDYPIVITSSPQSISQDMFTVVIIDNFIPCIEKALSLNLKTIIYIDCDSKIGQIPTIKNILKYFGSTSRLFFIIKAFKNFYQVLNFLKQHIYNFVFYNLPLCVAEYFEVSTTLDNINLSSLEFLEYKPFKTKKYISNSNCKWYKNCIGITDNFSLKNISSLKDIESSKKFLINISTKIKSLHTVEYSIQKLIPREYKKNKEITQDMHTLQNFRLNRNFNGKNFFHIWDCKESFFYNRPIEKVPGPIWRKDPRGLMSMNLQYIGANEENYKHKTKCDCLIPQNGLGILVKVKFDDAWTKDKRIKLKTLTMDSIQEIISKYSKNKSFIDRIGNDLYYKGKKFLGQESSFNIDLGYVEDTMITCSYIDEKRWFDMLFHHPNEHPITGITDEVPTITKELLIKELYKRIDEFFREF